VRICLVYDCLYPFTVGGAERWYANLGRRLAAGGHTVTYLTLRQWDSGSAPSIPGVDVIAVGPRMSLYKGGRRRILPPLVFGAGVLWHLLRRRRRYDVVHTASFPYFSVLAAAAARVFHRYRLVVDWHEVWSDAYWRDYVGNAVGRLGSGVQRLCLGVPQQAFCFSRLHEHRLLELGVNGTVTRLEGEYDGPLRVGEPRPAEPLVVFAGRHVPEKCVLSIPPAILHATRLVPDLRCEIFGDGPDRSALRRLVSELGLEEIVDVPGFVDADQIERALSRALCLLLPSRREGYGLVVLEAAVRGTPSIVVQGPDNAATELVEDGVNGFVAPSASAEDLAHVIAAVANGGLALRQSTSRWFQDNATRLSLEGSLELVVESYGAQRRPG
jgi:glycosyltransferase involved in cell wall biosynthesis